MSTKRIKTDTASCSNLPNKPDFQAGWDNSVTSKSLLARVHPIPGYFEESLFWTSKHWVEH